MSKVTRYINQGELYKALWELCNVLEHDAHCWEEIVKRSDPTSYAAVAAQMRKSSLLKDVGEIYEAILAKKDTAPDAPTYTGPTPPAPPFADASEESAKGVTCDLCGFSDATCVKVTDDEAEDEELAKLEYVRYTCRNCGHRWHEAV